VRQEEFRYIQVEGTPYEMGYQHGQQCKELIAESLAWAKTDGEQLRSARYEIEWA